MKISQRFLIVGIDGLMSRFLHLPSPEELPEEDPLSGIANLFDVSVVFIVGLMITLFSVYRMADLVDAQSEVTMVKTNAQGERDHRQEGDKDHGLQSKRQDGDR